MTDNEKKRIQQLAFFYQYVLAGAAVVIPIIIAAFTSEDVTDGFFFWLGIFAMLYGAYTALGYLFQWKHIWYANREKSEQSGEEPPDEWDPTIKKEVRKMVLLNLLMGGMLIALVCLF